MLIGDKIITVYSIPSCPWCNRTKEYLEGKGMPFMDYNVVEDQDKLEEMMKLTGQRGVPVIVIGGEIIVGFDQKKIDEALAE